MGFFIPFNLSVSGGWKGSQGCSLCEYSAGMMNSSRDVGQTLENIELKIPKEVVGLNITPCCY